MKDPGDGSVHESPNLSVLKYAGDGLWSYEEDAYNPMNLPGDGAGVHPAVPQARNHFR